VRHSDLHELLEEWYHQTNQMVFIDSDPICVPHRFIRLQDIEISGFLAAIMSWGNRKTIISKCNLLLSFMDDSPYDFIKNAQELDMKRFEGFAHRTLNDTDVLYLLAFLRNWFKDHDSLEAAFSNSMNVDDTDVKNGLIGFYDLVFSTNPVSERTKKHIASPAKKSACKRLNMYLRWMVRQDNSGVDFGIWKGIRPSQLICPLDVHVQRVSLQLGLLSRNQTDWMASVELTKSLQQFDMADPVKYDYALFGLGLSGFGKQKGPTFL
jgi:uncharacterized protein (TIGR02757 family)